MSGWKVNVSKSGHITLEKWIGKDDEGLLIAISCHKEFDNVHMQVVSPGIIQSYFLDGRKLNDICQEADEKVRQLLLETMSKHQIYLVELEEAAGYGN